MNSGKRGGVYGFKVQSLDIVSLISEWVESKYETHSQTTYV